MPLTHTSALLTIATPNFDRLVDFYQHLLDQNPVTLIPNIYAEFHLPDVKLGIFRPKSSTHPPIHPSTAASPTPHSPLPTPPQVALCLEVENLEAAIAHLIQLGSLPGDIMTASHGREVYAYDPEGNWLIVHQSHIQA